MTHSSQRLPENIEPENKSKGLLEEYRSLRQEIMEAQKARIWGTIPYLVLVGGVATIHSHIENPSILVVLIFGALPFLWHTANRERAHGRISAYLKEIVEPQVYGLEWNAYIEEWRRIFGKDLSPASRIVDLWRYILALTGVYAVIVVTCFIILLLSEVSWFMKVIGFAGMLLIAEAYHYFNRVLTKAGARHAEIFRNARKSIERNDEAK